MSLAPWRQVQGGGSAAWPANRSMAGFIAASSTGDGGVMVARKPSDRSAWPASRAG